MQLRQTLLSQIDFDSLTKEQLQEFAADVAERLSVMTYCCQMLVNEFERSGSEQQKNVLAAFVNDMNQLDARSGSTIERVAALGTPPKVQ